LRIETLTVSRLNAASCTNDRILAVKCSLTGERTCYGAAGFGGQLNDHAVIVGFGRVGSAIGRALDAWDLPYVAIERDRRLVERLRAKGLPAVHGDASAPGILAAACVRRARLVIIATPDGYQARRILELARQLAPEIDTIVRTHSEAERTYLESQGVGFVVEAERETALGMTGYALRSMGLSEGEARLFVQSSRKFDDAGLLPRYLATGRGKLGSVQR
jgi:CPA2 family monovalent cation:H+ antiporter-2